jgi:phenylacetate-CoA ligase
LHLHVLSDYDFADETRVAAMSNLGQDCFDILVRTQFMPVPERERYQRGLLERLLRHARAQVPYYRDTGRLDPLFKSNDEINWERWREVPPLIRREAQENAEALYAEVVPPECGSVVTGYTAGSTGTPLAFRVNSMMGAVGSGAIERGLVWAGLPAELSFAWFRNDRDGSAAYPHGEIQHTVMRGMARPIHYLAVQTPVEQQGHWLARVQPDVVVNYPGALAQLARNLPDVLSEHRFRLAICVGEVTTDGDREAIEAGFRCPVLDLYSGAEFGPVAVEDPRLHRMFVCEETSLVELVAQNAQFARGEDGLAEVILTPFYNYAMPLIRYSPGDFAVVDQEALPDGRTLRRLERVVGRQRNVFILPSGRRWWPTYQNKILYNFLDYRQIQFAQTAPDRIEIRFASDQAEPIRDADKLRAYLHAATPEPMRIDVTRVADVPRRASGKYEYATCEIDPSAQAARIDAAGTPAAPIVAKAAGRDYFAPLPSGPYRARETTRAMLQAWRRTQYLPPGRIEELQRALLEPLLRHARAHVPFYRDSGRLDPVFRRDGTIDWARWGEIPALTRREVQEAGSALHAERLPLDHGRTWLLSTSGTTGEPIRVVHDALSGQAAWTAIRMRDYEHHKIDPTHRIAIVRSFVHDTKDTTGIQRHTGWIPGSHMFSVDGERVDLAEFLLPARIIDELAAFQPKYLQANPVELEMLCHWDQEYRLRDLKLETAITFNDHLSDDARRFVTQHLHAKIMDRYASEECGHIATSCAICGRLHVHAESIYAEILGDDGRLVGPGEIGWVIVTPLYNYAMPLIRYHHHDRARVGAPGQCEITLPALDAVLGKDNVVFTFPDGSSVRPLLSAETIMRDLGAQIFQVAQIAKDRCEFRIVPGRIAPDQMRFDNVTRLLRARWWSELQIDYRILDQMPSMSRGRKFVTFVQEMRE